MGTEREGAREKELPSLLLCLFNLWPSPQCPGPQRLLQQRVTFLELRAWESCE